MEEKIEDDKLTDKGSSLEKRFVSMLSDYGFKVTFGNETDTTFLRRAIQALIKSETAIEKVEFNKNELTAITKGSRGGLYDVICTDEKGQRFIIEMQVGSLKYFIHRAKFYGFYHFNSQIKRGQYRFDDLKKIYVISILAGIVYPEIQEYHHEACLRNQHGELIDDQITFILVELGKWNKSIEEAEKENLDIDKLLHLMKMTHELTLEENKAVGFKYPSFFEEDWIQKAIQELDLRQMSPEKRAMIEMQLMQEAQLAYHYEEMKQKAEEAEQKAEEAEQKALKSDQEKEEAKQKAEEAKQKALKSDQEKEKAKQKAEEAEQKALKSDQEKEEAKQKALKSDQEKEEAKQKALRLEQELEQEKAKAEQKAKTERSGHKLLIKGFLKINYSKEQVAELQNWSIDYVEDLAQEIEQEEI
jgi:predicted transposase/invertase (TIGR01784 family)